MDERHRHSQLPDGHSGCQLAKTTECKHVRPQAFFHSRASKTRNQQQHNLSRQEKKGK